MQKKILLIFLLAFIGLSAAFPASLEVVDRSTDSNDSAEFKVNVQNDFPQTRSFRISSVKSPKSSWFYVGNSQELAPGENHSFPVTVTADRRSVQQNIQFELTVRSGERTEKLSDYFSIVREHDLEILSISKDRAEYRPGEAASYSLTILNTAPREIGNYTLSIKFLDQTREKEGPQISSGSQREVSFNLEIPENTRPGEKKVRATILRDGERRRSITDTLQVKKVTRVEKSSTEDDKAIIYSKQLTAENTGNTPVNVTLNETLDSYLQPLTVFSEDPDRSEKLDGEDRFFWHQELAPGESFSVSYTVNYWVLIAGLALLLAGLAALKKLRQTVKFEKSARDTEEGVKIRIELENVSGRSIHGVEVKDFVPDIATVEEDFPMAKPVIRKTENGTRLTWEIEEMEPGDQRVFEYIVRPLVEVEGGVEFPEAELEVESIRKAETDTVEAEFRPDDT
ncbi:MAG: hypothetical protein ABEJ36_03615 [Candidatus Nanosalina sp.]